MQYIISALKIDSKPYRLQIYKYTINILVKLERLKKLCLVNKKFQRENKTNKNKHHTVWYRTVYKILCQELCKITSKTTTQHSSINSIRSLTQKKPHTEFPKPHKPPNNRAMELIYQIDFILKKKILLKYIEKIAIKEV